MKKPNIYQNQSQALLHLFEEAGSSEKVMCVPMDYAKNDHLVMFCNGHGQTSYQLWPTYISIYLKYQFPDLLDKVYSFLNLI